MRSLCLAVSLWQHWDLQQDSLVECGGLPKGMLGTQDSELAPTLLAPAHTSVVIRNVRYRDTSF